MLSLDNCKKSSKKILFFSVGCILGHILTLKMKKWKKNIKINKENNEKKLDLDKEDTDLRVLRKAETIIRDRTENLVLILEKLTNSDNHSAIIRTSEALGI